MSSQRQQIKTAGSLDGSVALGDIMGTIEVALNQGMPMDSVVKVEHDETFRRDFVTITHDPTRRRVSLPIRDNLPPVEQAIEARGDRLVEVGFVRSSDARKPITVRIQVTDDASNIVMTSLDLSEHDWAAVLAGSVIKVKDQL